MTKIERTIKYLDDQLIIAKAKEISKKNHKLIKALKKTKKLLSKHNDTQCRQLTT